ncbi:hypothetical protein KSP39_PZI017968 [Platanthera zijinensis]|uniref:Uncharacterized protein n=1 Tax=Platanthera zijinensis TaxID=2320716 RepID=A0AAP0B5L7_9ASPA
MEKAGSRRLACWRRQPCCLVAFSERSYRAYVKSREKGDHYFGGRNTREMGKTGHRRYYHHLLAAITTTTLDSCFKSTFFVVRFRFTTDYGLSAPRRQEMRWRRTNKMSTPLVCHFKNDTTEISSPCRLRTGNQWLSL